MVFGRTYILTTALPARLSVHLSPFSFPSWRGCSKSQGSLVLQYMRQGEPLRGLMPISRGTWSPLFEGRGPRAGAGEPDTAIPAARDVLAPRLTCTWPVPTSSASLMCQGSHSLPSASSGPTKAGVLPSLSPKTWRAHYRS